VSAVTRVRTPLPAALWQRLKRSGLLPADAQVPGGAS
jgi:hypothetical protein